MGGGYIRVDKEQPDDTRLLNLADQIAGRWQVSIVNGHGAEDLSQIENRHALRNALLGALVTLWCYADTHIRSDNSLPVTLSGLAPKVGLPVTVLKGFPACWLIERGDGLVELPGFCERNAIRGKDLRKVDNDEKREARRKSDRERQKKHRANKKKERHGVTRRGRSRRHGTVTPPTGTGTGPLDPTGTVPTSAAPLAAAHGAAATPRKSFDEGFRERFGVPPTAKAKP